MADTMNNYPTTPFSVSSPVIAMHSHNSSLSMPTTPVVSDHESDEYFSPTSSPSIIFVFPDVIAFDRVKDKCHHAFDAMPVSKIRISGFESYLVEQWVYNRMSKNQIVIYTGNPADSVVAYRLEMVNDPLLWPASFRHYINDLSHSKYSFPTQSEYGTVYVTNVAQLDASLSLVAVPGGNLEAVYFCYIVNHDLKRLGCGSRSATAITVPTKPIEDKFKSTFHIAHQVPLDYAVRELVCVLQTFLYYYGLLLPQYCDGLYCDLTELALSQWWRMISDIRFCTTLLKRRPPNCTIALSVESVIGVTLFVRTLLDLGGSAYMSPKDPLDSYGFRSSVSLFQKSQKIHRSKSHEGFLDHETLIKLFEWGQSMKANQNFAKDLTKVKNIVKNTVMDFTSVKAIQSFAGIQTTPSKDASRKVINCQDFDQILLLTLGKRLTYLFLGKGKPVKLEKESLAARYSRAHRGMSNVPDARSASRPRLLHSVSTESTEAAKKVCENVADDGCLLDEPQRQKSKTLIMGGNFQDQNEDGTPCPCYESVADLHGCPFYQQDTEGLHFERRLKRRHSIPSVEKEANFYSTELEMLRPSEDINRDVLYSAPDHSTLLRRSNSFSLVDETLEGHGTDYFEWRGSLEDESLITSEWLAVQYIELMRQFKLGVLKRSKDLKREVASSRIQFVNEIRMDRVLSKYQNSKNEFSKAAAKYHDLNEKFKTSYKVSARLKYELRLLLQKTKEVESNLKSLEDFKIKSLEQNIQDTADNFHVDTNTCQPCAEGKVPSDLDWNKLISRPHLIIFMFICYIRCLWLVYFENKGVSYGADKAEAFQAMFQRVYNGVGAPKLLTSKKIE
ncbi:DEKNAAC102560 [Brettanomyces naardenensis]|uniref:DEKNAAC102560 n=1 Tax=Brettanomyces naardenensis TaxID=13370 RepID=A0A448YLB6_BRENA|nr:DEKNAAC102560 [Brettanomyces naardenensis]